jgi:hypothetical protein
MWANKWATAIPFRIPLDPKFKIIGRTIISFRYSIACVTDMESFNNRIQSVSPLVLLVLSAPYKVKGKGKVIPVL